MAVPVGPAWRAAIVNDAPRRVAYVVARYVGGPDTDVTIWDAQTRTYGHLTGTVDRSRIDVYDMERNCHLCGPGQNGAFTLYDFGDSTRLTLRIRTDGRFDGHHDRTNTRFTGRIQKGSVDLYDYGSLSYFNFQVRLRPPRADQTQADDGHRTRQPIEGARPVLPQRRQNFARNFSSAPPPARTQQRV